MTAHERYEARAAQWVAQGRRADDLTTNEWALLALLCWLNSDGARKEGYSADLLEYARASNATLKELDPEWFDRMLEQRDHCGYCGERYRIENLALCTRCLGVYCWRCIGAPLNPPGPNGNRLHGCAGDGELVG